MLQFRNVVQWSKKLIKICHAQKRVESLPVQNRTSVIASGRFSARDARSHKISNNVFAWGCFSQSVSSLDDNIDEGYRIKEEPADRVLFFFLHRHRECCTSLTLSSVSLFLSLSLSWRGREIFTKISHQVRLRWVYYILGINLTIIINN